MKKFSFLVLLFLSACSSLPSENKIPLAQTQHTIYVVYQGWHTSIVMDAKPVREQIHWVARDLNAEPHVRVGWGDGDYFTGKSKSVGTGAKALFASSYSALQVLPYDTNPLDEIPTETRVPVAITRQGLQGLVQFIDSTVKLDSQGKVKPLRAYDENTGYFYESKYHYSMLNNCNTWTLQALRAAGLPLPNRLTAQGVFKQAKYISDVQKAKGAIQNVF